MHLLLSCVRQTRWTGEEIHRATGLGTWNVSKPTKFFIHGYLDHGTPPWWIEMKNALLDVDDVVKLVCKKTRKEDAQSFVFLC
ncbi:unnamed protein product [Didymodactylos carnosus]|uniref:Triacylglycerol lipase n=1 Tax=Didymodactylos carnosus TaxID=1234261 RepID=A0A8S2UPP4_9BILA|nr:unnamed protein product [Didymodactylos carnosus]CAF4353288.1 unnamed protein product [Didymodactylos carnosus]